MEPEAAAAAGRPRGSNSGDVAPGSVPEDNRPGHHPEHEQDRPDPQDFVERSHQRAIDAASSGRSEGAGTDRGVVRLADLQDRSGPVASIRTSVIHAAGDVATQVGRFAAGRLRRAADLIDPGEAARG